MTDVSVGAGLVYRFVRGGCPLIVSIPHVGTALPPQILPQLTTRARALPDTDWCVDRLYDFVLERGASVLAAHFSRYVVDLNRPPDDGALYPGRVSTGLCPRRTFAGEPLYRNATSALRAWELDLRRRRYWRPYHEALAAAIADVQQRWGCVLLLDAHSIRSRVPRLFSGRLPDINLGTDDGRSCDARLVQPLLEILGAQSRFSFVLNGRFKGGYITRHYGAPALGVHALQIELAQAAYMDEGAHHYEQSCAAALKTLLRRLVDTMLAQASVLGATPRINPSVSRKDAAVDSMPGQPANPARIPP